MERMSDAEWRKFVTTGTRTGKLAVTQPDGTPHVTPVWFLLDEDEVVFTTSETSLKGKALAHNPKAAICVDDETPPYSYVVVKGSARLSYDLEELMVWATEIGRRYMGDDRAEEFGGRNAVPGEYLVRLRVENVVAHRAVAD
jgi:PPOX class probable F420-dependent enzyme